MRAPFGAGGAGGGRGGAGAGGDGAGAGGGGPGGAGGASGPSGSESHLVVFHEGAPGRAVYSYVTHQFQQWSTTQSVPVSRMNAAAEVSFLLHQAGYSRIPIET